jgi:DeoR/GlpR family transcriptional regulator of sugar metabolism
LATAGISPVMRLTHPSLSYLIVKSAMIKSADKVFLVADSSKIGITAFANLEHISLVHTVITDSNISEENLKKMSEQNVDIFYSNILRERE